MVSFTSWARRLAGGLTLLLVAASAQAAGLMTPTEGGVPPLELREQHVTVDVEDGYAITEVEQVFHNPHDRDLEAHYRFPVPEKGTVAEFTVWIDGKPVVGEVLPREKARQVYEQEKAAGREAGLTEKDQYKAFDVRVSPVRGGGDTRVRLVYMQPAGVDTGVGRYVYPLEEGGVDQRQLDFWTANERVEEHFTFTLNLRAGYPVAAVRVPDQPGAAVTQQGPRQWRVTLDNRPAAPGTGEPATGEGLEPGPERKAAVAGDGKPAFRLDRDIVVYWRHPEDLPGTVDLVAYKPPGSDRGTFMMSLTPGDDLPPVSGGRDWVFVLDVSGSMAGKLATLADGVGKALGRLQPEDRFRIVLFNDGVRELTDGFVAVTPAAVNDHVTRVAGLRSSGGTNLYDGLKSGLKTLDDDRPTGIVLVADGVANVGVTAQKRFLELLDKRDVRLFTFIMGNSANRPLLTALTDASNGFALSVSNSDDIVGRLMQATGKLTHQAMNDVRLDIEGVKTADRTPARIGSVYRGERIVLMGHYWGDGPADVTLSARVGGQERQYRSRFTFPEEGGDNPELERLWAYATIQDLARERDNFGADADLEDAITDLALEYGLVTDYTSMVVLRDEVFEEYGIERRNADRRDLERLAKARREASAPASNRADQSQPMFQQPRASMGGGGGGSGGAAGPWSWLPFLVMAVAGLLRRRR